MTKLYRYISSSWPNIDGFMLIEGDMHFPLDTIDDVVRHIVERTLVGKLDRLIDINFPQQPFLRLLRSNGILRVDKFLPLKTEDQDNLYTMIQQQTPF